MSACLLYTSLAEAITEIGKDYVVNEGDGAFYGPKLAFHLADSIGRTWQGCTIQLDMPVSYTHLGVYKGQLQGYVHDRARSGADRGRYYLVQD